MRNRSIKRIEQENKYRDIKKIKKTDLINENKWVCFFSNIMLDEDMEYGWHHLMGRDNEDVFDYDNIFPALWEYHNSYHHDSIDKLVDAKWYVDFLVRIKDTNPNVFNKEINRITKLGKNINFVNNLLHISDKNTTFVVEVFTI